MIVTLEGFSGVGKTTLINKIRELRPYWVFHKGYGPLEQTHWEEYIRYEHMVLNRLNVNNPEQIFLCDRSFSEMFYNTSKDERVAWKRLFRMHKNYLIIWLTKEIKNRNSNDVSMIHQENEFIQSIKDLNHVTMINGDIGEVEQTALVIIGYIEGELAKKKYLTHTETKNIKENDLHD